MVALAMAAALSIIFAGNAEAKRNNNAQRSIQVFCNPDTFNQCTNNINPFNATQNFTALSGTPRSNNVHFKSRQSGKVFSSCTFQGRTSNEDEYFCKTNKNRHKHR